MAVAPRLPKLAPEDMAWARWVTNLVGGHDTQIGSLSTRITASNSQRSSTAAAAAVTNANPSKGSPFLPQPPVGDPQKPTGPQLSSDHATVTIRWDGNVDVNGATTQPQQGFSYVSLQRSEDNGQTYLTIGNHLGLAGTVVDVNVVVGETYFYRLFTTDTLGRTGPVSVTASIEVVGVDLGSLDQDLQDNLSNLQHSATTGGLVVYSDTAPTDPKYHAASALWFDTSPADGAVPKRWNDATQTWVAVPYGSGALGEGSIVSSKILAGAIDTAALGANAVTANKISAGAITTEKIGANAVVANTIAAGAIDADKIAVGAISAKNLAITAAPAQGTPTNRVPRPLNDQAYWSDVISGAIKMFPNSNRAATSVVATASGISVTDTGTNINAYLPVTAVTAVPTSRQLHVSWTSTGPTISPNIRIYDAAKNQLRYDAAPNGAVFTLNDAAVFYSVTLEQAGPGSGFVSDFDVFEVIGGATGSQQAAQLSPSGLRLFNDEGQLSVDITTSTTNFISILNGDESVLTLDENGNGNFNGVQANDDFYYQGNPVVGTFADMARSDGTLDGPLFNRLPWGVQYAAAFKNMDAVNVTSQYQRLATGSFNLAADRTYEINVDLGGLQTTNNSGVNVYVELQLSTDELVDVASGTPVMRSVVYTGDTGYFSLPPLIYTAPTGAGLNYPAHTMPPNTDLYWQINTNLGSAPTAPFLLHQYTGGNTQTGMLTIKDLGPAITIFDGTDRTTSGGTATGTAGSGSGGGTGSGTSGGGSSTTKTVTKTWDATWSASWNSGGSNKVTGSGTYTDGQKLYQGLGASNMGAKFGFPASVATTLAGKTISKVEVFIQNRWTYYNAGGTATFAGHSNTAAGASFGSTVGGTFNRAFDRGQGRWLTVGNTEVPFASWKSGAVRGLALVVQGGSGNYSYYDGVGKSKPPKLRITYK